jgi:hypothetical protein
MPAMKPSIIFFGWKTQDWPQLEESAYFIEALDFTQNNSTTLANEKFHQFTEAKIFVLNTKILNSTFNNFITENFSKLEQLIWILLDSPTWQLDDWQFLFNKFKILKVIPYDHSEELRNENDEAWSINR